jgi:hypothetical protein
MVHVLRGPVVTVVLQPVTVMVPPVTGEPTTSFTK